MLERILEYESGAFLYLNGLHSPFLDQFMWLFTGKIVWLPVAIAIIFFLFYKNKDHRKEAFFTLMAIVLVVTLCDQFASGFCKPFFERPRPTKHPDFMNEVHTVFGYRGGRYGFISSHAANAFGFVTLTSLIFRNKIYSIAFFTWAVINSYSRIYLGVHFISDILPAVIAGTVFGWTVYLLYKMACDKFIGEKYSSDIIGNERFSPYTNQRLNIMISLLLFEVVMMLIASLLYSEKLIPAITIK